MVWVRALRTEIKFGSSPDRGRRGATTWAALERELLRFHGEVATQGRLQAIRGVVKNGNDPRRLVRRIACDQMEGTPPLIAEMVSRKPSGRASIGEKGTGESKYWQIPVDLVEAGEALCPGSSRWENAALWELATPVLPSLEQIRSTVAELMYRMDLHTPSLDDYRELLPQKKFAAVSSLTRAQVIKRYAISLQLIAKHPSADALSLLALLVADSFLSDEQSLLELHCAAFHRAVEQFLSNPLMADIQDEFRSWISVPILTTQWVESGKEFHTPSITEPFVTLDMWDRFLLKNPSDSLKVLYKSSKRSAYSRARADGTAADMPETLPPPRSR